MDTRPWYKSIPGIIFLSLLSLVLTVGLIFAVFFGYYLWEVKYGDAEKLAQKFASEKFTLNTAALQTSADVPADVGQFVRPYSATIGEADAPITVLAFLDFQCPYSQPGYSLFAKVVEKYQGAVRIVFKHMPLATIHPQAMDAANAIMCAKEQNKFWEYYDLLFTAKQFDQESMVAYAESLKLDKKKFTLCLATKPYQSQIDQDMTDAATLGVRGTPTYFVNRVKVEGVVDEKVWDKAILQNLR